MQPYVNGITHTVYSVMMALSKEKSEQNKLTLSQFFPFSFLFLLDAPEAHLLFLESLPVINRKMQRYRLRYITV